MDRRDFASTNPMAMAVYGSIGSGMKHDVIPPSSFSLLNMGLRLSQNGIISTRNLVRPFLFFRRVPSVHPKGEWFTAHQKGTVV